MAKRVPYCTECDCNTSIGDTYSIYYCKHEKIGSARLGVDKLPQRSPLWCPKRPNPDATPESKSSKSKLTEEEKMFLFEKFGITFKY